MSPQPRTFGAAVSVSPACFDAMRHTPLPKKKARLPTTSLIANADNVGFGGAEVPLNTAMV